MKLKLSNYRPDKPLLLQEVGVPRITTKSGHEGGKVVSLTPMTYPWYSFILWDDLVPGAYATGRNNSMKYPDDPIGDSTRDLPNFSAVRQANASPCTPIKVGDIWELAMTLYGQ